MSKRRIYITLGIVFFLAILAGLLNYPAAWNKAADFLNSELGIGIPYFFNIPFKLGLDLQGGAHLVYQSELSSIAEEDRDSSMQGLRDAIERRVNSRELAGVLGVLEPSVQIEKRNHRLIIDLPGEKDTNKAIQLIGLTPSLEFKEQKENFDEIIDKNQKVFESKQGELEDPFQTTPLTGRYLKKAELTFDQTTYKPEISLQFNDEGAKIFEDLTAKNIGKLLAIYLDNQLTQAPVVQEKISGGQAQITGNFTLDEAKKHVQALNYGALPVPIKLISQQSVGPTLGAISLDKSLKAGLIGFLAVVIFMIIFYRLPGVLSSLALAIYIMILLAIFKLMSITFTLAGIAGIILSVGMAVDANVLIFSRMREELKQGKGFSQGLEEGFKRAWPAIRDGNLTTLVVTIILFGFGTSFIKGFATTLTLGILVSMFSAVFVTKNFLKFFEKTKLEKINWLWK